MGIENCSGGDIQSRRVDQPGPAAFALASRHRSRLRTVDTAVERPTSAGAVRPPIAPTIPSDDVLESQKTPARAPLFETHSRWDLSGSANRWRCGSDSTVDASCKAPARIESKTVFCSCRSRTAVGYQAVMRKRIGA